MQKLKLSAFICFCIVIVVLTITTLLDKITGIPGTADAVYGSTPFALMWAILAILATAYILRRKLWKMPATLLLHVAFLIILCGALTTHIFGEQGAVHVRKGIPTKEFIQKDGLVRQLPFIVKLDTFKFNFYQGTMSPQDYISTISIIDGKEKVSGTVSMNNIFSYRSYRFYQAGFDEDGQGSKFSIAHDPYGIAITYTGYILLLISMFVFFFEPKSHFRQLIRQKSAVALLLLLGCNSTAEAKNMPKIAPTDVAEMFSDLYILHNGRVCPVSTYAHDYTTKLYGKSQYRGRKAEEVLAGWIFFPDTWKPEPMIKIKGEVKEIIGKEERYVALLDFANQLGEYKLEGSLKRINNGEDVNGKSDILAANEKINIINSLFTGAALKIFPVKSKNGHIEWYSMIDKLPQSVGKERWTFIKTSLNLVAEDIIMRKYTSAKEKIQKIKEYQIKECGQALPTEKEFNAEKTYNKIGSSRVWAMMCVTVGLLAFFYFVWQTARQRKPHKAVRIVLNALMIVVWAYISYCMYLRTVVSHHLPMSNGFETMQAMAWSCFLMTFFLQKKYTMSLPFGFIVGGFALMVAMIGESNPAITNLMPVLNSPLLSIHVMVIMISYALLAFTMLNGITAMIFMHTKKNMEAEVKNLQRMSQIILYPAIFLLTAGIFIGAVWANVSWGTYWSWDPKETWALITLMIYSITLHTQSLPVFSKPKAFHIYMILAFLSIVMTYYGVNFILGGMHSYA